MTSIAGGEEVLIPLLLQGNTDEFHSPKYTGQTILGRRVMVTDRMFLCDSAPGDPDTYWSLVPWTWRFHITVWCGERVAASRDFMVDVPKEPPFAAATVSDWPLTRSGS
jgi:hypothetical protein